MFILALAVYWLLFQCAAFMNSTVCLRCYTPAVPLYYRKKKCEKTSEEMFKYLCNGECCGIVLGLILGDGARNDAFR